MKRALLLLGVLGLGACLADVLEDAPCHADADCLGEYHCAFTPSDLHVGTAGRCRSDGRCAAGRHNGCAAAVGGCEDAEMQMACDEHTGACFCCDLDLYDVSTDDTIAVAVHDVSPDATSARCVVCDSEACDWPLEACARGWDRCVVGDDDCGCRLHDDQIENSLCDVDADCGDDFTCERTLEQREEPAEKLPANQVVEAGACRPHGEPVCDPGQQNGCRIDTEVDNTAYRCGKGMGLVEVHDADGQSFCCRRQSQASGFVLLVYAVTPTGTDAACTECSTSCEVGTACTAASHTDCVIENQGLCGCTPS